MRREIKQVDLRSYIGCSPGIELFHLTLPPLRRGHGTDFLYCFESSCAGTSAGTTSDLSHARLQMGLVAFEITLTRLQWLLGDLRRGSLDVDGRYLRLFAWGGQIRPVWRRRAKSRGNWPPRRLLEMLCGDG